MPGLGHCLIFKGESRLSTQREKTERDVLHGHCEDG